ncbi:MAG: diguanylate cyclase [bacterium]|nr:diguanylate cyclase [bacterium]
MKHTILIIDDSAVNINALYVMLKEQYHVVVAKNGKEGIKLASNIPCSLIFLDILMPEMNGFEVLNVLMENPTTKSVPVMFITSLKEDKYEEKGLRLGAVDYITKPFNPSVIKAKVKNHIELFEYRKTIENIAMLDGLTAVPNRRSYNEKIKEYWCKALSTGTKISISIVDIDCFKEYNDNYGHLQGDVVLKRVAQVLKQSLPNKRDFVARYGGEEFVVVLWGYDEKEAYQIMDGMRKNVKALQIEHLHSRADKVVTVSIGGNTLIPNTHEIEKNVDSVDKRLYRAKSLGRNQIVWDDQEQNKGQIEVFLFGRLRLLSRQGTMTPKNEKMSHVLLMLVFLITNRQKEYTKQELVQAIWPYDKIQDENYQLKKLLEDAKEELGVLKLSFLHDLIVMRNGTYHWNTSYMCIVDTELFENLYTQIQNEQEGDNVYRLCERAVELYQGDYLSKVLNIKWVNDLRERYRSMYYEILSTLLSICYAREEYIKIIELSRKVIFLEAFDSRIHYYYLRALIQLKRNKEALEHFEYIEQEYYTVLGITPPESILNLYLEILESSDEQRYGIGQVESLLKETDLAAGAYYCDLHVFKNVYQLCSRRMIQNGETAYLCIINMENKSYLIEPQKIRLMQQLQEMIMSNLCIEDVFCKLSETQYAVLLPCTAYDQAVMMMESIINDFYDFNKLHNVELHFELQPIELAETLSLEHVLIKKKS